jgi:hypothetical protein
MGALGVLRAVVAGGALLEYEELEGIEWEWQAIDGAMRKAPLGRGASGNNPTDRAKMGTKRSMLSPTGRASLWRWPSRGPTATTRGCWWQQLRIGKTKSEVLKIGG